MSRLLTSLFMVQLASISAIDSDALFRDLALTEEIDRQVKDELPFFYNFTMMGGYFNMPSGRMPHEGAVAFGAARVYPYNVYGLAFQYFDRLELSANYRVFTGITEGNFGHLGFGDDAERIGNVKFVFNLPEDGFPMFPAFAIGVEDVLGTKRFNAEYVVMTQAWKRANIEATLGWGRKRIKGLFGGIAWTPFRQGNTPFFKNISLLAEYDATDYANHAHEHPQGRGVKSRINAGVSYVLGNTLQLSVSSLRGQHIAASGSLRYPLGTSDGLIKKSEDPLLYASPVDTEPLGVHRPDREFAQELAYAFGMQGIDLYQVSMNEDRSMWVKVINNRYRKESVVRERIERVLAATVPSNVPSVTVIDEADGVLCQAYKFRTEDLFRLREGKVGEFEMESLSPMREAPPSPDRSNILFHRTKKPWTMTFRPRLLTFFGSSSGKIKYNVGLVLNPEGYLFDQLYYEAEISYEIKSSTANLGDMDRLNPSQLPNVRTDTIRYFQTNTVSFEMAYLQKNWNWGRGCFFRLSGGYFEAAYGGGATEFLWYPVNQNWAVGLESAVVRKRKYHGLGFTDKIRKLDGFRPTYEKFLGVQYFFDLYYTYRPWDIDFKIMAGQFLAKDLGAKFEVSRWFKSGLNVSLWCTVTNGNDHVNGQIYFDKGFAISLPIDFFFRKSSRTYIGYAIAAWLRDVGAVSDTGKTLYPTIRLERE